MHPKLDAAVPALRELVVVKDLRQHVVHKRVLVMLQADLAQALENARDAQVVVEGAIQVVVAAAKVLGTCQLTYDDGECVSEMRGAVRDPHSIDVPV